MQLSGILHYAKAFSNPQNASPSISYVTIRKHYCSQTLSVSLLNSVMDCTFLPNQAYTPKQVRTNLQNISSSSALLQGQCLPTEPEKKPRKCYQRTSKGGKRRERKKRVKEREIKRARKEIDGERERVE